MVVETVDFFLNSCHFEFSLQAVLQSTWGYMYSLMFLTFYRVQREDPFFGKSVRPTMFMLNRKI